MEKEYARGVFTSDSVAFDISYVCQRWRRVALECTQIWATITRVHTPALVEAILPRSGHRPLRVFQVDVGNEIEQWLHTEDGYARSIRVILQHASRLESLKLNDDLKKVKLAPVWAALTAEDAPCFPNLIELEICCPYNSTFETGNWDVHDEVTHDEILLPQSRFPALRTLVVSDYMFDACALDWITSLHLIGDDHEDDMDVAYFSGNVLAVIKSLGNLQSFGLDLYYSEEGSELIASRDDTPLVISSFRHLNFGARSSSSIRYIASLFELASYPNLETLSLELICPMSSLNAKGSASGIKCVMEALAAQSWSNLRKLSLSRGCYASSRDDIIPLLRPEDTADDEDFFAQIWAVEELTLRYTISAQTLWCLKVYLSRMNIPEISVWCDFASLERLDLNDCPLLRSVHLVPMLKTRLSWPKECGQIPHICISNCDGVEEDDLDGLGIKTLEVFDA